MDQPLYLRDHLCFSLYACSRAISRMYRPLLNKLGITYPQYLVLLVLWEQKEQNVKELGEALDLDSGTLTPLLKRMETSGLLRRHRSEQDERMVTISLTEQGKTLREEASCIPQALLNESGLSVNEIQELNLKIKSLTDAIKNSGI
ncbi:MAG: MarR family winged helix-turn-helix transcriptional regulator [Sporolactobacillus sp.]